MSANRTTCLQLIAVLVAACAHSAPSTTVVPAGVTAEAQSGSRVSIETTDDGYELLRNGEPYVVRGVGGTHDLELVVSLGANSIRTWGAEEWPHAFERAAALDMTVCDG